METNNMVAVSSSTNNMVAVSSSTNNVVAVSSSTYNMVAVSSSTNNMVAVSSFTNNMVAVSSFTKNMVAVSSLTNNMVAVSSFTKNMFAISIMYERQSFIQSCGATYNSKKLKCMKTLPISISRLDVQSLPMCTQAYGINLIASGFILFLIRNNCKILIMCCSKNRCGLFIGFQFQWTIIRQSV